MKAEDRRRKTEVGGRNLLFGWRRFSICCLLFSIFCLLSGCGSIPNLEAPQCVESRGVVKELYSFHFGNEMRFSPENLQQRERFLTPELTKSLQNSPPDADVFTTRNTDFPKAFRIGKCEVAANDKTNIEVLLFWKTDTRTEQREIYVEVVKQGDKWLVNKILN